MSINTKLSTRGIGNGINADEYLWRPGRITRAISRLMTRPATEKAPAIPKGVSNSELHVSSPHHNIVVNADVVNIYHK